MNQVPAEQKTDIQPRLPVRRLFWTQNFIELVSFFNFYFLGVG
jgi:hypothetical protein